MARTGVTYAQYDARRFAQDLATLCPGLWVETRSADLVLRKLQYDANALQLGSTSIVLAISQSGQTFPTLQALERIKDDFIDRSVIPIVGTTVSGDPINSPTHRQLIRSSGKWALHVTETPTAWGIHALYILITVGFQVPLVQTLCRSIFAFANLSIPGWLLPAIVLAELREARFGSFDRLLASYVFFWWLSKKVASFPLLRYQHWKSQSRTRIMTTAAPVSRTTPIETSNRWSTS